MLPSSSRWGRPAMAHMVSYVMTTSSFWTGPPAAVGKKGMPEGTAPCWSAKSLWTSSFCFLAAWNGQAKQETASQRHPHVRDVVRADGAAFEPGKIHLTSLRSMLMMTLQYNVRELSIPRNMKKTLVAVMLTGPTGPPGVTGSSPTFPSFASWTMAD
eukprot:2596484-Pyramimonas_sp.AAC.1